MSRTSSSQRGMALLEAMIAMIVVAIGATGAMGLHMHQLAQTGEARHTTTAAALAQDMVESMSLWAWNDTRLADSRTSNNSDIGDAARAFEGSTFEYDHAEADLGSSWTGLPARAGFERYWNVATTGRLVKIAVIVRWQQGSGWRRLVAYTARADMSGATP